MVQQYRNIYQIARESTGFTQEKASELIGISIDSIRAYEGGKRIPPDNTVIKMIEIYDTQYLAYQHLKTKSKLGDYILPDVEVMNLSVAILKLQKEVKDFTNCEDLLIKIGSNGIVNDDEVDDFKRIMKELDEVVEAIMTLKYSKKRGEV